MLNRIVLIGRLTADPELRSVGADLPVTHFTVAVDRPFAKEGQQSVDFIDCVAWRRQAETVTTYLKKGRLVAVEGRLQVRSYTTQDGAKRRVTEVVCDRVEFLPDGRRPEATADPEAVELPEDLPF